MDLEAWKVPASRLGLVAACVAGVCCPAAADDNPPPASVQQQFQDQAEQSLALMLTLGPQVMKVTKTEIVIWSFARAQCTGTTQPNALRQEAIKKAVAALKAYDAAKAKGKPIKIVMSRDVPSHCMDLAQPTTPPASAPTPAAAPASAASR